MGLEQNIPVLKPGLDIVRPNEPQPQVDELAQKLYMDARPGVVKIVTDKEKTNTGFIVQDGDSNKVVTTARAALNAQEHFALGVDGKRYKLEIESLDDLNDLAVMKISKGQIPGSKPLELGSAKDITEDMHLYGLGVPQKYNEPYLSPGYVRELSSPIKMLAGMNPEVIMQMRMKGMMLDPISQMESRAVLGRPLIESKTHMQRGGGGGPVLDETGKVVGVLQLSNGAAPLVGQTLIGPADAVTNLLANKGRFDVTYKKTGEPWTEEFRAKYEESKLASLGSLMVAGGIGYAGYLGANRYPLVAGGALAAYGLKSFAEDGSKFLSSSDSTDSLKYGLATVADVGTAAGAVMSFIPRARAYGFALAGLGVAGRAATDFIQNHLVVDKISRKNAEDTRPPLTLDTFIK